MEMVEYDLNVNRILVFSALFLHKRSWQGLQMREVWPCHLLCMGILGLLTHKTKEGSSTLGVNMKCIY